VSITKIIQRQTPWPAFSKHHAGWGTVSGLFIFHDLAKVVIPSHEGGSDEDRRAIGIATHRHPAASLSGADTTGRGLGREGHREPGFHS